ncbi:glycosyltransferase family 4 protein [Coleofasciculus sp. H7-2]|uniref:glycosyltransferase family 4 protein n=1 Tax=Coleofasciculus sp. H7-2 TaxID=3351545 RepID=UPI003671ABDA
MRIAQIAPLWEQVPPLRYGGIELIVSLLTDELVRRGHQVTLFASGDSITKAQLKSVHNQALRLDPKIKEHGLYELMMLSQVYQQAHHFDIIHSHIGCAALPYTTFVKTPTVHTTHGIFTPDNEKLFRQFAWEPYISISEAQREPRLGLNYIHTVYNGIDPVVYSFQEKAVEPPYLAFVGRISPEKGPEGAIKIARASGYPLKMAGKVDSVDKVYFQEQIKPLIDGEQIQYLGEVSHEEKVQLLGGATVTLFPITWREPFGLVMIESMATGTPVVGMAMGSVPEVIAHGKSGFVCHSLQEMIDAVPEAMTLNRQTCRDYVLSRFSVKTMVDEYERAYQMALLGNPE